MRQTISCISLIYLYLLHFIIPVYCRPLLVLNEDYRGIIPIASFGFLAGGQLKLEWSEFKVEYCCVLVTCRIWPKNPVLIALNSGWNSWVNLPLPVTLRFTSENPRRRTLLTCLTRRYQKLQTLKMNCDVFWMQALSKMKSRMVWALLLI